MKSALKSFLGFLVVTAIFVGLQCVFYFNSKHKTTLEINLTETVYNEVSNVTDITASISIGNSAHIAGHTISAFKYKLTFKNEAGEIVDERIFDGEGAIESDEYEATLVFGDGGTLPAINGKVSTAELSLAEAEYMNSADYYEMVEGKPVKDSFLFRIVLYIGVYVLLCAVSLISKWLSDKCSFLLDLILTIILYSAWGAIFLPLYSASLKLIILSFLPPL